jgi:hypothetical protein
MKTETEKLVSELMTLKMVCERHEEKVREACEAWNEACEFAAIPTKYGLYTIDISKESWRYPSVEAASKVYNELREDNGYFWASSRLRDLEMLLGAGWNAQLPLRMGLYVPILQGHIPEAHESVSEFVSRYSCCN